MKDFKSIMIGFLLATCMFLFMGQTNGTPEDKYFDTIYANEIIVVINKLYQLKENLRYKSLYLDKKNYFTDFK